MQDSTEAQSVQNTGELPEHLVSLGMDEWAIWRWVGLRSAGFSHDELHQLAMPACVAAAENYLELEASSDSSSALLLDAHNAYVQSYQKATLQTLQELQRIASGSAFREALIWQNRHALHTGVDVLLATAPDLQARSSKYRQKEALVTSYIQRYCAKNDTIGFFGPVGWARCVEQGALLSARPGSTLLASRTTYFEGWCIDALAAHLAQQVAIQPWLAPRLLPHVWLTEAHLHVPLTPPAKLTPAQAAVLAACDGVRTAQQIASLLVPRGVPGLSDAEDVYALLREFRAKHRIAWTLEISAEEVYPEQHLRRRLALIGDDQVRIPALAALDELETQREKITQSRGDSVALDRSLAALEASFTRLTGESATRRSGATYAGRTLVYEDCRRGGQVELGPEFTHTLGPPLALLLQSARWFTVEAAALYRSAFQQIYDELRGTRSAVPFGDFWLYAHGLLFDRRHPLLMTLRQSLQLRWQNILLPRGESQWMKYRVADLQQQVATTFAASRPGWRNAYYHCPDLMIAAPSVAEVCQGRYFFVLGEIHPAGNTLRSAFFVAQHPNPEDLYAASAADCREPLVFIIPSREVGGANSRMSNALVRSHDWRLVFAGDSCDVPGQCALPVGLLEITDSGQGLKVQTRDQQWDVLDFLGDLLMLQILQHFTFLPANEHTPRISFDHLVVQRETWRFAQHEFSFATIPSESERFLALRRWLRIHQLPRFVFVKIPTEPKPLYVDFDSLASIDVFARALRRSAGSQDAVCISEMLPTLDETWLTDQHQRHYTCELRLVVVDRTAEHIDTESETRHG